MQKENKSEKTGGDGEYGITDRDKFSACSSTDCTGLIPSGEASVGELEAYEELYPSLYPPVLLKREEEEK